MRPKAKRSMVSAASLSVAKSSASIGTPCVRLHAQKHVQTPRNVTRTRKKERGCETREYRVVRRCLDSQSKGDPQSESQKQQFTEESCGSGAVTHLQGDAKDGLRECDDPTDRRDPTGGEPGIKLCSISAEVMEVSPCDELAGLGARFNLPLVWLSYFFLDSFACVASIEG